MRVAVALLQSAGFAAASAANGGPDEFVAPPMLWERKGGGSFAVAPDAVDVACVGDSITAGYLSTGGMNYPNQLQTLLGAGYKVTNYGVGGTTMLKKGDNPYWNTAAYTQAAASNAAIVVLMLGTNDAKHQNWNIQPPEYGQFVPDYLSMINVFKGMASKPQIYIMTPPPLFQDGVYGMNQTVINAVFPSLVPRIAAQAGLPVPIDLFDLFKKHCGLPNANCDWIGGNGHHDACHPDNVGYGEIAKAVARTVAPSMRA